MASKGNTGRVTRSSTRQNLIRKEPLKASSRRQPAQILNSDSDSDSQDRRPKITKLPRTPHKQKATNDLEPVTPPKQRKLKASVSTPSTLFKTLALSSPIKADEASPQNNTENGFKVDEEDVGKSKSQYVSARKALHSNFPTDMPGREKEIDEIKQFIDTHLDNETSGSIYISGPPGTGKTAALNLILENKEISSQVQQIYINCTAVKSASAVYMRLNKELHIKVSGKSEKDNLSAFEKYLSKKHKTVLIVLDEIDQLETKNHSILYTIFEWPARFYSGLILVGIANALDLTDRMLPRLQARCELKPKLLHFAPYTKNQIIHIFTSRLRLAGVLDVFSPVALQMLAGKVAAISGDVRRALDIGRRVVEMIDANKKGDILKSVENFTNQLDKGQETKTVNLQEVVSVLNNVYGTSQNLTDESEETFPLQQKIVICSLLLMLKKAKNKDITVGKLHEVYSKVCRKRNLTSVDQAEFVGLCSLIETKGIIKVSGKKEARMHKVTLEWNESEVSQALKDKQLMSSVLQDEACLGKI